MATTAPSCRRIGEMTAACRDLPGFETGDSEGGRQGGETNVRVMAATNRNLQDLIAQVSSARPLPIEQCDPPRGAPAARAPQDIPLRRLLLNRFITRRARTAVEPPSCGHRAEDGDTVQYAWPGGVRQSNVVERLVVWAAVKSSDRRSPARSSRAWAHGRNGRERRTSVADDPSRTGRRGDRSEEVYPHEPRKRRPASAILIASGAGGARATTRLSCGCST
jgi:DNA-binding NtrC family response regulator